VEFVCDRASREPFPQSSHVATLVRDVALRHGLVVYPGSGMAGGGRGDIVSVYPPLTFDRSNIDEMTERLTAALEELQGSLN